MVNRKQVLIVGAIIIGLILAYFAFQYFFQDSFDVTPIYPIKINSFIGGNTNAEITITNNEKFSNDFSVEVENLDDVAEITESSFSLASKESKTLQLVINDAYRIAQAHVGKVIIESTTEIKEIPVLISFEEPTSPFAIIYEEVPNYENVYPGGKLGVEIKIFDIYDNSLKEIKASYFIKNFDGKLIDIEENKPLVIEGKHGFLKVFDIPDGMELDDYVLITYIDYNGSRGVGSYLFNVEDKTSKLYFNNLTFWIFIIFAFIVGIIILFFYFMKTRDELFLELKKQQGNELQKNLEILNKSRQEFERLKNPRERKVKIYELDKLKKKVVCTIKSKQKEQRKEFKVLKKKKKKNVIQQKLASWKRGGYVLPETKKGVNKISKEKIKDQVGKWGSQGFETSFLKK